MGSTRDDGWMGWWERKERRFDGSRGDESEENKNGGEKKERMKIWKRKDK